MYNFSMLDDSELDGSTPIARSYDDGINLQELCQLLGIEPALSIREMASWVCVDDQSGCGINAFLIVYDREIDGEPFDISLSIYETSDGRESPYVVLMEFIKDEHDDDRFIVSRAEFHESVSSDFDQSSLHEILHKLGVLLATWPMERDILAKPP